MIRLLYTEELEVLLMLKFSKPDVEQFLRTFTIADFAVTNDESQLVFSTNLSGKYNLWALNLPNTFPVQLTFNDQRNQGLLYDEAGEIIIAGFDHDGDEFTQFYALPRAGGTMKKVFYEEGTRNSFALLSKNRQYFYYTSSKENPSFFNTYRLDLQTGEEQTILQGSEGSTVVYKLSPNEQQFIYLKFFANTYTLAYVKSGEEHILLTPKTEEQHTVTDALFASEQLIYLLTNYDEDDTYLASYHIQTHTFKKVKYLPKESFSQLVFDEERGLLYIRSGKGVEDFLYCLNTNTDEWEKIETPCTTIDLVVLPKTGTLYLLGGKETKPSNIYKKLDGKWQSLTNYVVPGVDESELVASEVLSYSSYDGLEIEALLYKAKAENDNGQMIFWPHGGPQAAERKEFRAAFQFFLNNGYSIFAPNFRGSTGYGLQFTKMVEGDWGHGPRLDHVAGLNWLIKNGHAKKGEILLMGGSFGGYMALLLHGRHADYFKAVVDIFGPSDLFSFINSVPEDWKPIMDQWVGNPERDREKLIEYSPITYIENMTKPMLVVQGANDPRVVKEESDQIVQALQEKGRKVEYMLLEDEGHGFSKKENEIAVYRKILQFMEQFR